MKTESEKWLEILKRQRKELRLTQEKFAALIGMSKDAVVSWEIGRNKISAMSALRISACLGVNLYDGTLAPVTLEELVAPRVREYERELRRRLGESETTTVTSDFSLKAKPDEETSGGVNQPLKNHE